eukprot:GHVU01122529.1.p1 GENE.GHVU01122529.1~~GHVU01122529.1.p1  ORF type:complete len:468 (+),score=75.46 GHVU01122529.1:156-1559(+)
MSTLVTSAGVAELWESVSTRQSRGDLVSRYDVMEFLCAFQYEDSFVAKRVLTRWMYASDSPLGSHGHKRNLAGVHRQRYICNARLLPRCPAAVTVVTAADGVARIEWNGAPHDHMTSPPIRMNNTMKDAIEVEDRRLGEMGMSGPERYRRVNTMISGQFDTAKEFRSIWSLRRRRQASNAAALREEEGGTLDSHGAQHQQQPVQEQLLHQQQQESQLEQDNPRQQLQQQHVQQRLHLQQQPQQHLQQQQQMQQQQMQQQRLLARQQQQLQQPQSPAPQQLPPPQLPQHHQHPRLASAVDPSMSATESSDAYTNCRSVVFQAIQRLRGQPELLRLLAEQVRVFERTVEAARSATWNVPEGRLSTSSSESGRPRSRRMSGGGEGRGRTLVVQTRGAATAPVRCCRACRQPGHTIRQCPIERRRLLAESHADDRSPDAEWEFRNRNADEDIDAMAFGEEDARCGTSSEGE